MSELIDAVHDNNIELIELLLEQGIDLNKRDNGGNTALIWALYKGYIEIVRLLLENGAKVNILIKVVNVEILRDKRVLIKRILIEELPEEEKIAGMKQNKIDKVEATGITVEDIDEKIKKKLNIYGGAKVIDISDGLTNNSKIRIDDIIKKCKTLIKLPLAVSVKNK